MGSNLKKINVCVAHLAAPHAWLASALLVSLDTLLVKVSPDRFYAKRNVSRHVLPARMEFVTAARLDLLLAMACALLTFLVTQIATSVLLERKNSLMELVFLAQLIVQAALMKLAYNATKDSI